jgi:hypothetical protein
MQLCFGLLGIVPTDELHMNGAEGENISYLCSGINILPDSRACSLPGKQLTL